jgi:hypothetical protein
MPRHALGHLVTHDMRSSSIASSSSFLKGKLRSSVPNTSLWLVIIWWSWNLCMLARCTNNDEIGTYVQRGPLTPSAES